MPDVVTCACGKRFRLPEGKAKAIRCPHCQGVVRLDGVPAAPPAAPPIPAAAPAAKTAPPRPAPALARDALPPEPPSLPSTNSAPAKRLIQDPPNVWLYVEDPQIIAKVEAEGDSRQTSLRTYGPGEDALADLGVPHADEIRDYLGKNEYIAWAGSPSNKKRATYNWIGYVMGGIFALLGLGVVGVGFMIEVPFPAVKIGVSIVGGVFALAGFGLLIFMLCGATVFGGAPVRSGLYLITNRRAIVWVSKITQRSFSGPMVTSMVRMMENEDEDVGHLLFSHGMDGSLAGFMHIDKVSEVEELVRGYLIDRVLEKAGDGLAVVPLTGPNPFKKGEQGGQKSKAPRQIELWQAAALAMEAEKPLTPEMIKAAKEHTKSVLGKSELSDNEVKMVRDQLEPGEAIAWVSKANTRPFFKRAWIYMLGMLFILPFMGGMLYMASTMVPPGQEENAIFADVFLGFGAFAGLGLLCGALYPFYARWLASHRVYVLTTRRALVWAPTRTGAVKLGVYGPRALSNVHVRGNDVVFRTQTTITTSRQGTTARTYRFGFLAIDDAPVIERMIRELLVDPFLEKAYE